ncbi:MAG: XdhC/CoxI family protein [Bacteroidales bacterium]
MEETLRILEKALELQRNGEAVARCVVIRADGSTPAQPGFQMLVGQNGRILGTVGGGNLELTVIREAREALNENKLRILKYNLKNDLEMQCGGSAEILVEPWSAQPQLYIFGAGHVGTALAKFAAGAGFTPWLIDPRPDALQGDLPEKIKLLQKDYTDAAGSLPVTRNDYIAIMTPGHDTDRDVLTQLFRSDATYIGMIGSKRKIATVTTWLKEKPQATDEEISRIDMPIGLPIGAVTPQEIAISILAKMIQVRHDKSSGKE